MPNTTPALAYWLALARAPGVGPHRFAVALNAYPQLQDLFTAAPSSLPQELQFLTAYLKNPAWAAVEKDMAWANQADCHIVSYRDAAYPALLREISHAPPLLFIQGKLDLFTTRSSLAIVGSRNPSTDGREIAYRFAHDLVACGLTITSGLAIGIDAASHQGALRNDGQTIAVMGTGLDIIYPACHRDLAKEIIAQGALISEFPLGTLPKASHFPQRNRLISGLSLGVLVVEAAMHSGSLITARYANEQNREVFAIPGSIHNPLAKGCHTLLKQGAKLVEAVNDILEELQLPISLEQNHPPINKPALSADYQALLAHIGYEPTPIDLVISRSGLTAEAVSSMLLELELYGVISVTPGGYSRI